jgi:hypothetical protein
MAQKVAAGVICLNFFSLKCWFRRFPHSTSKGESGFTYFSPFSDLRSPLEWNAGKQKEMWPELSKLVTATLPRL